MFKSDIFLREDEFYKENEKVELKTKELLEKVNDVMKIQENLIKDNIRTQIDICSVKSINNNNNNSEISISRDYYKQGVLDQVSSTDNNLSHIYRKKLKDIIVEKEKIQNDFRQKLEDIKKLEKENSQLKDEKTKWFAAYNYEKNINGKLENQFTNLNNKLRNKDAESIIMKKEIDKLNQTIKIDRTNLKNLETKLMRVTEENGNLKLSLKNVKDEEKEFKETYKKQINELTAIVKESEKQKMELLNGFKKQMHLIDILRKQKINIEATKLTKMTETEYMKILDWKI